MRVILILLAVFSMAGCGSSSRAVYDNIQTNKKRECSKLPPPEYEQCMQDANKTYDEYERERREVINGRR